MSPMDERASQLHQWLLQQIGSLQQAGSLQQVGSLEPADSAGATAKIPPVAKDAEFTSVSGDASFRRYFRLRWSGAQLRSGTQPSNGFSEGKASSVIGVDAPPSHEDCAPFVRISAALLAQGVQVPAVLAYDATAGFMMLDDFGDTLLRAVLNADNVDRYYGKAMADLLTLQASHFSPALPPYDEALLLREMALFPDWFLKVHLQLTPTAEEAELLSQAFDILKNLALEQPRVTVHRDYHSRNIMVLDGGCLGHIDFQDAVHGPITYDLVSLLRDCYIDWPQEQVYHWSLQFAEQLRERGLLSADNATFQRWLDAMGAQRHLKAIGIFARLFHRDGKAGYLGDIPRTLAYLLHESSMIPALAEFHAWLQQRVVPALIAKDPNAALDLHRMGVLECAQA
ncbi:Hypothetical protein HDN1F_20840 [gamma proteobacterium HdN1]|nr:Hypothetical protein HDN1F_20840 [gamma proteobacterium HdN1]